MIQAGLVTGDTGRDGIALPRCCLLSPAIRRSGLQAIVGLQAIAPVALRADPRMREPYSLIFGSPSLPESAIQSDGSILHGALTIRPPAE